MDNTDWVTQIVNIYQTMLIPLNAIIVTINFIVSYLLILTLLLGLLYLLDL